LIHGKSDSDACIILNTFRIVVIEDLTTTNVSANPTAFYDNYMQPLHPVQCDTIPVVAIIAGTLGSIIVVLGIILGVISYKYRKLAETRPLLDPVKV